LVHAGVRRGASEALGVAVVQSDEPWLSFVPPGWLEGYDAECCGLDSLEFTTAMNAISDGVDVDEILRDSNGGGACGGCRRSSPPMYTVAASAMLDPLLFKDLDEVFPFLPSSFPYCI
jgi:hypothetical protein